MKEKPDFDWLAWGYVFLFILGPLFLGFFCIAPIPCGLALLVFIPGAIREASIKSWWKAEEKTKQIAMLTISSFILHHRGVNEGLASAKEWLMENAETEWEREQWSRTSTCDIFNMEIFKIDEPPPPSIKVTTELAGLILFFGCVIQALLWYLFEKSLTMESFFCG